MLDLLDQISASVEWVVAFRLTAVTQCATGGLAPELVFLLEPGARRPSDEFVVLTARGRYLAEADCRLRPGDHVTPALAPLVGDSVARRYAPLLDSLSMGEADCVGVGALDGAEPVAMAVKIVDGLGAATAVFARAPTRCHYELLPAVGVRCQDVQTANGQTVVRFENQLPEHLLAGLVSGFARTHHCNLFFLRHGAIDAELEQGLLAAGEARLKLAVRVLQATAVRAGLDARAGNRAMTCLPPPPQAPFPYGNLVPLGLLLRALRRFPEDKAVDAGAQLVRRHLDRQRQGLLWSFHTGGLATATDTPSSCWGTATQRRSRIWADLPMLTGVSCHSSATSRGHRGGCAPSPDQRPLATGRFRHNLSGPLAPARGRPALRRSARHPGSTYGRSLRPFLRQPLSGRLVPGRGRAR